MSPGRHGDYSPQRQRRDEKPRRRHEDYGVTHDDTPSPDDRSRKNRRDRSHVSDSASDRQSKRHRHDADRSPDLHRRKHHDADNGADHSRPRSKHRKKRHSSNSADDENQTSRDRSRSPRHISRDRKKERHFTDDQPDRVRVKKEPRSPDRRDRRSKVKVKQERESPPSRDAREFPRDAKTEKTGPDFGLSGKLAADTNTYKGVVIKYNQPPEARKPRERWRLYPFKGDVCLPVLPLHRSSGYLIGRDRLVADIPVDHPSCSKQHSVLQFRLVDITKADGTMGRKVKPYVIDLGSTNGTYLNGKRIDAERYHELREKDVLKFGFSSREYVLLHEKSQTEEVDEGFE